MQFIATYRGIEARPIRVPFDDLAAWKLARQFAAFCLVGVLNTFVDIGLYFILTRSVWSPEFITVPKILSYIAATLSSFTLNRYWTFGMRGVARVTELIRFYSTVGLGIFVNVGVHFTAAQMFGINDIAAAALAAIGTAIWGFLFAKFYVFK